MDVYSQEIQEKNKDLQNQPLTIKKMTIGTYISIITLNVNGLNASTKRHRLAEWIQKQGPCIWCLQETTSDLKTHIDQKCIPYKWEAKESWSICPHIRQSRP